MGFEELLEQERNKLQRLSEQSSKDIVDNQRGVGRTYSESDANYFGLRVLMTPSKFLELSLNLPEKRGTYEGLVDLIAQGEPIGSPFLYVDVPKSWFGVEDYQIEEIGKVKDFLHLFPEAQRSFQQEDEMFGLDDPSEIEEFYDAAIRDEESVERIRSSWDIDALGEERYFIEDYFGKSLRDVNLYYHKTKDIYILADKGQLLTDGLLFRTYMETKDIDNAHVEVIDHEGRHRMSAVLEVYGDVPIEVFVLLRGGLRRKHLEDWMIDRMDDVMISQDGVFSRDNFETVLNQ